MNANMPTQRSTTSLIFTYIACYLILIIFGALTMWLLFSLRGNLVSLSMVLQVNPWVLRAIDRFGIFLLGLGWLATFILIESYFRMGIHKNDFWRRAGKMFVVFGLVAVVSQAVNWLF